MDVLQSPTYLGKSGARTLFSIQTSSGKYIQSHSYFQHEDEILLPPGIYLKVVGQLNPADGLHIIHLQEVASSLQLLAAPYTVIAKPISESIVYSEPASPSLSQTAEDLKETQIEKPSDSVAKAVLSGLYFFVTGDVCKEPYCTRDSDRLYQ